MRYHGRSKIRKREEWAETRGEWGGKKGERGMWVRYRLPGWRDENGDQ
jgi:hypothetical protein